jgi:hypothetical protein
MKVARFKQEYRKSTSQLHRKIGEILKTSPSFRFYRIYQEYPVSKINPNCTNQRLRFDWVILDLKLIIEGMGKQHEIPTDFSGKAEDGGVSQFQNIQYRDKLKKDFAENAGWTYIAISYKEENILNEDLIISYYIQNHFENSIIFLISENPIIEQIKKQSKEKRTEYLQSDKHKEHLQNARTYQRELYKRKKARDLENRK